MTTRTARKPGLSKAEISRMWDLRELRMIMCGAGRWTRDSYNICDAQRKCEEEIAKLVAKRDGKIWL